MSSARTKKRRSNARKASYSKKKFKKRYCSRCALCATGSYPAFCYGMLYQYDVQAFEAIYKNLLSKHTQFMHVFKHANCPDDIKAFELFSSVFCGKACICTGENYVCPIDTQEITSCMKIFHKQLTSSSTTTVKTSTNKTKTLVPVSYTLISDDDAFEREILKILENYNKQQNKIGEAK